MTTQKILSLRDIAKTAHALRAEGKRVVLCHGTFDLVHTGHIRHLQCARQEGDVLGIRSEQNIQREIQRTEAAYNRLQKSGMLSMREQARANRNGRQKVRWRTPA